MPEILFVDDEPHVLEGIRRLLRPMREVWAMEFAVSGEAALQVLESRVVDVVVSDMVMPGMDGAELLRRIRGRWPSVARIILSGHSDRAAAIRSVGVAHQFLAKPLDRDELKTVVARTCGLRAAMSDPGLRTLLTELGELPAIPSLYAALTGELAKPEPSLAAMGKLIARDPGMSVRMLQLVNSAFFGLRRRVGSVEEAVTKLGTDVLRSLVLSSTTFTTFTNSSTAVAADKLWRHSLRVADVAASISASHSKDPARTDHCFQAGMLHDIGTLILLFKGPECAALAGGLSSQVGAYLLGIWGLEDPVVEAVAYHSCPRVAPAAGLSPLIAVHLARHLVHASEGNSGVELLDSELIERPDIKPHLESWLKAGGAALTRSPSS